MPLPLWRKLLGALGGLGALICLWRILSISDLSELLSQGGLTSLAGDTFRLYLAMLACLLVLAVSFSRAAPQPVHSSLGGRPLSGRTKLASVLSLLFVPLTIFIGIVYFGKKSYGVVSILVLLECMAPFALIFEGRISCFQPVTNLDRTGIVQIRPMLYIHEKTLDNFAARMNLPVLQNRCPVDKPQRGNDHAGHDQLHRLPYRGRKNALLRQALPRT